MPPKYVVEITETAEDDVAEIRAHIAADNRRAADRWVSEVARQIASLEVFPQRGSVIPEADVLGFEYRQLVSGKFRTIYRIDGQRVLIVRIVHGAQMLDL